MPLPEEPRDGIFLEIWEDRHYQTIRMEYMGFDGTVTMFLREDKMTSSNCMK